MARISVFGIGYVGAVSAGCLAKDGHTVIAVDNLPAKVLCINEGRSPIIEAGLDELIEQGVRNGLLRATGDIDDAIANTDISFVCVGTPSAPNGAVGPKYVEGVCADIGRAIKHKQSFHSVIIRSTIVPGTMDETCIPVLEEASGMVAGAGFRRRLLPRIPAREHGDRRLLRSGPHRVRRARAAHRAILKDSQRRACRSSRTW